MPNYDFYCGTCDRMEILNVSYENRDTSIHCNECGNLLVRQFPSPMVARASYPDGTTKRFKEFKEASKLNKEAAVANDSTKKEIRKELRKMKIDIQR